MSDRLAFDLLRLMQSEIHEPTLRVYSGDGWAGWKILRGGQQYGNLYDPSQYRDTRALAFAMLRDIALVKA